jgi:hypothetical protein
VIHVLDPKIKFTIQILNHFTKNIWNGRKKWKKLSRHGQKYLHIVQIEAISITIMSFNHTFLTYFHHSLATLEMFLRSPHDWCSYLLCMTLRGTRILFLHRAHSLFLGIVSIVIKMVEPIYMYQSPFTMCALSSTPKTCTFLHRPMLLQL